MGVVRVHKTANYTVMSNHHFKEKGLSLKAKGLLSLMLSLPDDWNYSISGLVTLSKDGKDSVMSALGELEKYGYLQRERITNSKGQFSGVEYNIYELPQAQKPSAVKQNEVNQNSEKPPAEKPRQLNTNQLSTNLTNDIKELNTKNAEQLESLLQAINNDELVELYKDYIELREGMNAPLTPKGLEMLIKRCQKLSNNNIKVQKLLLETAIINGWKNVFLPNEAELKMVNEETITDLKTAFGLD